MFVCKENYEIVNVYEVFVKIIVFKFKIILLVLGDRENGNIV